MKRRDFLRSATVTALAAPWVLSGQERESQSSPKSTAIMPRRTLGRTGVKVSALALGGVIGMQVPPSDDQDPVGLAEAALNLGVTYFDTAPAYNNGQSESNYGEVLARRRAEVFLATKTGDRTRDGTLRSIEQSLKRLRTDHVDLIQIHGVGTEEDVRAWVKPDGVLSALHQLRDQKVTRFIGVTGHDSAERLADAVELYEFDTLLTTLNPVGRRRPFRDRLLALANRKGLGVIAMKVMGGGNGCLVRGNPLKQRLRPYHDETDHQVDARSLLRYTLGLPVSVAVVGVASQAQLQANVSVTKGDPPMPAQAREELERLLA